MIVEKEVTERFELMYDYVATPEAMRMVKEFELNILEQDFKDTCRLSVESKLRDQDVFLGENKITMSTWCKSNFD